MASRVLLGYVLLELAVLAVLVCTVGFGWTVLVLLATFLLGLAVAGAQIKRQVSRLLAGLSTPNRAFGDSMVVALGAVLVAVPGLASTVLGVLILLPPTRAVARPVLMVLAGGRPVPAVRRSERVDYVDGEVIDITDVTDVSEPPALPAPRTP